MNTKHLNTLLATCSLVLSASPVFAQEEIKPAAQPNAERSDDNKPQPRSSGPAKDHRERHDERRSPQPEMKPTRYIGVLTQSLAPELTAQTGLAEGFGLIVEEVMSDSPAQIAGIKQHDVLVTLGDQKLVNQEQLSALVRAEKKDAEIVFTVRRAGAEQKITVKVGEKMMPVASRHGPDNRDGFGGMFGGVFNGPEGEHLRNQLRENAERLGREFRENGERFGEGMKQFGERMKEWSRGPKDHPAPQPPQYDNRNGFRRPPEQSGDNSQPSTPESKSFSSSSSVTKSQRSVTRRDDSGEYDLHEDNGAKVFTVRLKNGEEQTFIVNTDKQREAIPEAFRAKLKELENVNPPAPEKVRPKNEE